jgi:hypothetical protein
VSFTTSETVLSETPRFFGNIAHSNHIESILLRSVMRQLRDGPPTQESSREKRRLGTALTSQSANSQTSVHAAQRAAQIEDHMTAQDANTNAA